MLFCRGGWGERSCPRSATAIHSVAADRTRDISIEKRTLYHWTIHRIPKETYDSSSSSSEPSREEASLSDSDDPDEEAIPAERLLEIGISESSEVRRK